MATCCLSVTCFVIIILKKKEKKETGQGMVLTGYVGRRGGGRLAFSWRLPKHPTLVAGWWR